MFLTCGSTILRAGKDFDYFPPKKRVFFLSGTTLSLFGILSYIFTGSLVCAPYEFLLFADIVLFVGVFAFIKGVLKDRDFRDKRS